MSVAANGIDPNDRAVIVEILARYAEAVDAGDFVAVGELLGDATLVDGDGSEIAAGAPAITKLFEATTARLADGTPQTSHVITNAIVDKIDRDTVEMRSRFLVLQATESLALQPIVVGRYVDRVERRGGSWRIVKRQMLPQLWGDTSRHLTFDPRTQLAE